MLSSAGKMAHKAGYHRCRDAPTEEWRVDTVQRSSEERALAEGRRGCVEGGRLVESGADVNYYFAHGSKRRLGARFSFLPALGLLPPTAGLRLPDILSCVYTVLLLTTCTGTIGPP